MMMMMIRLAVNWRQQLPKICFFILWLYPSTCLGHWWKRSNFITTIRTIWLSVKSSRRFIASLLTPEIIKQVKTNSLSLSFALKTNKHVGQIFLPIKHEEEEETKTVFPFVLVDQEHEHQLFTDDCHRSWWTLSSLRDSLHYLCPIWWLFVLVETRGVGVQLLAKYQCYSYYVFPSTSICSRHQSPWFSTNSSVVQQSITGKLNTCACLTDESHSSNLVLINDNDIRDTSPSSYPSTSFSQWHVDAIKRPT